ncbi:MAG: hypothetical protein J6M07_05800, partial [Ruminococcus sp.]|nr:hypothetical protein [Ruminococcus sp.]
MTRKKITSVIAALTVVASLSGVAYATPGATPAAASSDYPLETKTSYTDNTHSINVTAAGGEKTLHNAMVIKKVLEVDDTANIPNCKFDFKTTVPAVPSGYANGLCVLPTNTTLAVYSGLHPENIKWSLVKATEGESAFTTNNTVTALNAASADVAATLEYTSQNPDPTATKVVKDNVLINSTATDDGIYYAIKEIQLDFEDCGFTEPGVYRYYIEEKSQDTNVGIIDDQPNTNTDGSEITDKTRFRTIDVYVDDISTTDTGGNKTNKLGIAGYVMYVGKQEGAPKNYKATISNPSEDAPLEDGLENHDLNDTEYYGTANGAEVDGAEKSEGFRNKLETQKLTFKKVVKGNQGSMNKYFKFVVKLTGNINDNDTFKISADASEINYDQAPTDNTATYWTSDKMTAEGTTGGNSATELTGAQLKSGYAFYLHDGQYITVTGIPKGLGYTITEYNEDYTPEIENGKTG